MAETKKTTTKEEVKLNPLVWEVKYNNDLIAQVLYVYFNNERKGTSNAKTRAEVSGGGRKPWKQKGTGRARSGSIRSPLWKGGGVTFGPSNKNWSKRINKKMAKLATCMVLSKRLKDGEIDFVNVVKKDIKEIRESMLKKFEKRVVFVTDNENVEMALRNSDMVKVYDPMKVNAKILADGFKVVIDNKSIKILEDRLTNGK